MKLTFSKQRTIEKGTILLRQGEVAKYGYYVKSGCLKSYSIDKAGKEHILQFAPELWLISDLDSFTNEVPSIVFVEAIENSEIALFSKSEYKEIDTLDCS